MSTRAQQRWSRKGKDVSVRRLSLMTGVHRKDAQRLYYEGEVKEEPANFAARVLVRWRQDKRFLTESGRPKVLTFGGENSEFTKLVRLESKEIRPGTVLFDLERVGAIKKTKNGLRLASRSFIASDLGEGFELLGDDISSLTGAVIDNLQLPEEERPNFHYSFRFDNIPAMDLKRISDWYIKQCSAFMRKVEKYVSQYDLDISPDKSKEGGSCFTFGSFSHAEEQLEEVPSKKSA